ncbi:MAG: metal-dependent transcriptional regulator [Candidatus Thermoplasmatota archaeon]
MEKVNETRRDREYLRALFVLKAHEKPAGPSDLSDLMDVSRVGALQKMRKIEELGYGEYIENKGLLLNDEAIEVIREDIEKHHLLEEFFRESLDMEEEEACKESSLIQPFVGSRLIQKIYDEFEEELDCVCGNCINPEMNTDPNDLYQCHWFKKKFSLLQSKS